MFDSTIAVISTALSQGAISIVRVSGDQAIEIVQKSSVEIFAMFPVIPFTMAIS